MNIYDVQSGKLLFVDPMVIIDLTNYQILSLKLSGPKLIQAVNDQKKVIMCMFNRARNKPQLIKYLKE